MDYVYFGIITINCLFIITMIVIERKKPEVIISWLLLFYFLPIVGFIIYILFGSGLSWKTKNMLRRKKYYDDNYDSFYDTFVEKNVIVKNKNVSKLIKYNLINAESVPSFNNNVDFFIDGKEQIDAMLADLENAKHSINMEYYIFSDDFVGKEVMRVLCKKASEGVKVKLIFDSVGCLGAPRRFFSQLKKAGGEVKEFFPPFLGIRLINLKLNYRNHRKIVVIDGKIGYVGGINIRKDHLGYSKRVSPWRDAHIRIEGTGVYALQDTFFNFWQFTNKKNRQTQLFKNEGYFPKIVEKGNTISQIITSGPNDRKNQIKETMIKMMNLAEKQIIIQTPYFVPDEAFFNTMVQAINSGVKVKLILPGKPDKMLVYLASLSYAKNFFKVGGEVYTYNGFIHSKTLIVDDWAMCIGTCNADNRSFALNFEVTSVLYNKVLINEFLETCEDDIANSHKLSTAYFNRNAFILECYRFLFRFLSPLL